MGQGKSELTSPEMHSNKNTVLYIIYIYINIYKWLTMCIHVSLQNDEQMSNKMRVVRTNLINMFQLCTVSIKIVYIYIYIYVTVNIYIYTCDMFYVINFSNPETFKFHPGGPRFHPHPVMGESTKLEGPQLGIAATDTRHDGEDCVGWSMVRFCSF